jgi:hypothetical protein
MLIGARQVAPEAEEMLLKPGGRMENTWTSPGCLHAEDMAVKVQPELQTVALRLDALFMVKFVVLLLTTAGPIS